MSEESEANARLGRAGKLDLISSEKSELNSLTHLTDAGLGITRHL